MTSVGFAAHSNPVKQELLQYIQSGTLKVLMVGARAPFTVSAVVATGVRFIRGRVALDKRPQA
eukprot:8918340-Karenia_brevis.AAC.1